MPINKNRSAGDNTRAQKARVLAVYHAQNPGKRGFLDSSLEASEYISRTLGAMTNCCTPAVGCSGNPGEFVNFESDFLPGMNITYNGTLYARSYFVTWDPIESADSYTFQFSGGASDVVEQISKEYYKIYTNSLSDYTITAINACGTTTSESLSAPCFLAGSLVQYADGTVKAIEDVRVGDLLLGAFGEKNMVLALHRPLLGNNPMCKINDEHSTTNHHPHVSADKQFYCNDPKTVDEATYGRMHDVIDSLGDVYARYLHGLKQGRVQQLTTGIHLKTVEGSRVVSTIDVYDMPSDTQLYNLVMGGSHTYHVDGYAVTGWPREDDFDYTLWVPSSPSATYNSQKSQ
jgi:hypothetical protein